MLLGTFGQLPGKGRSRGVTSNKAMGAGNQQERLDAEWVVGSCPNSESFSTEGMSGS